MSITEVRQLTRKVPFEPFCIKMSNGDTYEVRHPDMAAASTTSVAFTDSADQLHLLAMEHIMELQPLAKAKKE